MSVIALEILYSLLNYVPNSLFLKVKHKIVSYINKYYCNICSNISFVYTSFLHLHIKLHNRQWFPVFTAHKIHEMQCLHVGISLVTTKYNPATSLIHSER